jgi:dihydropteroate synthase
MTHPIQLVSQQFDLSRPYVMGVLNVTPDSFSDGGRFSSIDAAVQRALQIQEEGADLLDLGGESTRPGSPRVSEEEELSRVLPILKALAPKLHIPISIDTYKASVAEAALQEGAAIINDISGLTFDPKMARVVSQSKAPVILMHTRGKPEFMQQNIYYQDVFAEIVGKLQQSMMYAEEAGIAIEKIIVDPGFGFGKRLEDNHALLRRLPELIETLQRPVLVGLSRKASLGLIIEESDPNQRLGASIAAATLAAYLGAHFIRAHDVRETVQAVKVSRWLKKDK